MGRLSVRWRAAVALAALMAWAGAVAAAEPVKLRTLRSGDELGAAYKAEAEAGKLLRRCQDILVAGQRGDASADLKPALDEAIAAQMDMVQRFVGTEFEARAWQRLIYLHGLAGDRARAAEIVDVIAEHFAGTPFVGEAYRGVALDYLQRRNDPAEALKWFEKVPLPKLPQPPGPDASPEAQLAAEVAAQIALRDYTGTYDPMAKCYVRLGRPEEAMRLMDRLVALFPGQKAEATHRVTFEVESALGDRSLAPIHPVLRAWQESGRKEPVPDVEWAKTAYEVPVTPNPAEAARAEAAKPPIERLIAMLNAHWMVKHADAEMAAAIDAVRPEADEAVRQIMEVFNSNEDVLTYRHRAIRALGAIGTDRARGALLDIALGNTFADLSADKESASRLYVGLIKDKADARKLLGSPIPGVVMNGLQALAGQKIDEPLLADLERLVAWRFEKEPGSEMAVRTAAARVIGEAPNEEFAERRVKAVVAAIAEVSKNPKAGEVWWPGYWTYGESMYHSCITALAAIRGADPALARAGDGASAEVARSVTIARGLRSDDTVRAGLKAILADAAAGMFRAWAAGALGKVAAAEDLATLKSVADNDPMARDPGGCLRPPPGQAVQMIYPVRNAARQAIREIETRPAK